MDYIKTDDVTGGVPVVSVVIVNFNAGPLLARAIKSVLESTVPMEVFVVDNASSDRSVAEVRKQFAGDERLHIIENEENLGFARANNIALRLARGSLILLLNPDCVVVPTVLENMRAAMEGYPDAGMAGCLIRNVDGSEQAGCRRSVPTPWRSLVRVLHLEKLMPQGESSRSFVLKEEPLPPEPCFVEAISGAFMLVVREAFEKVGFLDEGYFVHCEDLDWCMRFRAQGWKILFVSHVEILHHKGVCSHKRPLFVLWHKHKGMVRFYRKFFRSRYPEPLLWIVIVAVWVRYGALVGVTLTQRLWRSLLPEGGRHTLARSPPYDDRTGQHIG